MTDENPTWADAYGRLLTARNPAEREALVEELHRRYLDERVGGTTEGGLPYPDPTDPIAQGADAIRALAEAVDGIQLLAMSRGTAFVTVTPANQWQVVAGMQSTVTIPKAVTALVQWTMQIRNAGSGANLDAYAGPFLGAQIIPGSQGIVTVGSNYYATLSGAGLVALAAGDNDINLRARCSVAPALGVSNCSLTVTAVSRTKAS